MPQGVDQLDGRPDQHAHAEKEHQEQDDLGPHGHGPELLQEALALRRRGDEAFHLGRRQALAEEFPFEGDLQFSLAHLPPLHRGDGREHGQADGDHAQQRALRPVELRKALQHGVTPSKGCLPRPVARAGWIVPYSYFAAVTPFLRIPTPSSSTSTTSPGLIALVSPLVPVKMMSPGLSVTCWLMTLTILGTLWIISLVRVSCTTLPLSFSFSPRSS